MASPEEQYQIQSPEGHWRIVMARTLRRAAENFIDQYNPEVGCQFLVKKREGTERAVFTRTQVGVRLLKYV